MPIAVACPGCKRKLTLCDDRAGTTLDCPAPGCGASISVPGSSPRPKPTPPPLPPPPPLPLPLPEPDEEPDPADADDIRRRSRPTNSRNAILLSVAVCVAVGVLALVAWRVAGSRKTEAATVAGVSSPGAGTTTPKRTLTATEAQIVGSWSETLTGIEGRHSYRARATVTYRADGTFGAVVKMTSTELGALDVILSGTWRLQGNRLVAKVESEEWNSPLPFKALVAEGKILEGVIGSEEVVSVSETHLITKDPETGRESVAERVK